MARAGSVALLAARPIERPRPLRLEEIAWIAAIPAAVVGVLAIVLLGPAIGPTLFAQRPVRFWSSFQSEVRPEPVEHGRYLLALTLPLLLTALISFGARTRRAWTTSRLSSVTVIAAQVGLVGFVVWCRARQKVVPILIEEEPDPLIIRYFTIRTLLVALVATGLAVLALRRPGARRALWRITRDTPTRKVAAALLAIVAIAIWLLHAFNTEGTIGEAEREVWYHLMFTVNEAYAVLDGRSPLVDFAAQYGSLYSYVAAAGMSLLGKSIGVWITLAVAATGIGMAAIYAVLRRVSGSAIAGLLLFLPVLATSFFIIDGTLENRYTFGNYFGTFPMRYAGPSVLVWLLARHLGGEWPRRWSLLFLFAGIVVLNNVDAGVPALGATVAAALWSSASLERRRLAVLARELVLGLAGAFAIVSALTLVRSGELPHLELLVRFTWLFASAGFAMFPMPTVGIHLVVFVTFVGALGVASVRALNADADRLTTGLLAWSGTFGLGAGAYYVGRSTPEDLIAIFFPWSLTVALLVVCAVRTLTTSSWRRNGVAAILCLFGFFVTACSLAQTPTPWEQLHRLRQTGRPLITLVPGQRFIAAHTTRGESILLLGPLGHAVAARLRLNNVSPYSGARSMPAVRQLTDAIDALRRAGGDKIFLYRDDTTPDLQAALQDAGYAFGEEDAGSTAVLWVDRRR